MGVEHLSTGWEPGVDPCGADLERRRAKVDEDLGYLPVVRWTFWLRPG